MFYHLLESSRKDDSNKFSNIGFGEEMGIIEITVHTLSGALHFFQHILLVPATKHICFLDELFALKSMQLQGPPSVYFTIT